MANVRKTPNGNWSLTVRNKLLPKPIYRTFDDEAQANEYGAQLETLLAAGIVPEEFKEKPRNAPLVLLSTVLREWIGSGNPARTDVDVLQLLDVEIGTMKLEDFTYEWCEKWVQQLKLDKNLAPGTIRKRIGSLGRALDWWLRKHRDISVGNPIRLLPRGAAAYNHADVKAIEKLKAEDSVEHGHKCAREDIERDRRLQPGEHERILRALRGEKRPDRERPLQLREGGALRLLYLLILNTGLRLREAYTPRVRQLDIQGKVLNVKCSKQWHTREKWRKVPLRYEIFRELTTWIEQQKLGPDDLIFPWWGGTQTEASLKPVTTRLSQMFARCFDYADCRDLHEHDLRHEATCRWYEERDVRTGQWLYREAEIYKVMGWRPGSKMGARYASFRAEDLAKRLWEQPRPDSQQAVARVA